MSSTDSSIFPHRTAAQGEPAEAEVCAPALALTSTLFSGDQAGLLLSRP